VAGVTYKTRQLRRRYVERSFATIAVAGGSFWLLINLIKSPSQFTEVTFTGLSNGILYALIALGYTLVYGIIELINFAHGDLFMLGGLFSAHFITLWFNQNHPTGAGYGVLILCLVAVMAFCGIINVGIERFAYRRLRRAPKLAPLITAVGMSFIIQFVGLRWNGSGQKTWPSLLPAGNLKFLGVRLPYTTLISFVVTIPVLLALTYIVTQTKQGKAMRATAQDQDASRLMGINVNRTISFTFGCKEAAAIENAGRKRIV